MTFTIHGSPVTKKNSQRLVNVRGRVIPLPSKQYAAYEKAAGWGLKQLCIDYPVNIKCVYYMPTRRRVDLCNLIEATCDILAHYHVIADDNRNIVAAHDGSRVFYDKQAPRVEITITPLENYEQWGNGK